MILYYLPGGCSQASHIALVESRLPFRAVRVDREKKTEDGRDFLSISPKGCTPALELDDGSVLTESAAILGYIAHKAHGLLASDGMDRWRTLEALSFMTCEVHHAFRPFFRPEATDADKAAAATLLARHFTTVERQLGDGPFLVGTTMTIADTYLFVMLAWAGMMGLSLSAPLTAYVERMKTQPSVLQALRDEGLM